MFRDITTYECTLCGKAWTAPKLSAPPACPKCHRVSSVREQADAARRETAPRV